MEILLLQDVAGIGKKNDLLIVGDGFALNCLLPQRKALVATPTVRKRYAEQIKKRALEKDNERQLQQQAAAALSGKTVQFTKKGAKGGKLYAAITAEDISKALLSQHALTIAADDISIDDHIKAVGTFQVQVKVGESNFPIGVIVAEEKAAAPKAKKEETADEAVAEAK